MHCDYTLDINGTGSGPTFFENTHAKVSILFLKGSRHTIDFALILPKLFCYTYACFTYTFNNMFKIRRGCLSRLNLTKM